MASNFPSFAFKPERARDSTEREFGNRRGNDHSKKRVKEPRPKKPKPREEVEAEEKVEQPFWIDKRGESERSSSSSSSSSLPVVFAYTRIAVLGESTREQPLDTPKRINWRNAVLSIPFKLSSSDSDDMPDEIQLSDYLTDRKAHLNKALAKNPNDVDSWFAFIANEKELLSCTKGMHKALADQRLASIYKRAVSENPEHARLRHEYLNLLVDNTTAKWKEAARSIQTVEFFDGWINATLTTYSNYSILEVIDTLIKDGLLDLSIRASERLFVLVVYKLSKLLRDAGYVERAVAIWQGLLELSLFRPPSVSEKNCIAAFRLYWNMETKRFGDVGSNKWLRTDGNDNVLLEQQHAKLFPVRSVMVHEEDPDRTVLFQDIEPFMRAITDDIEGLLNYCMSFFGADTHVDSDLLFVESLFSFDIQVELVRQITHSEIPLPEAYLAWSFEFLRDHEFYPKYSKHILKKYNSSILYQIHGSIMQQKGDMGTYRMISQGFAKMPFSSISLNRWVTDKLLCDPDIAKEAASIRQRALSSSSVIDTTTEFIVEYLSVFEVPYPRRASHVLGALTRFWEQQTGFHDGMTLICDILVDHFVSILGLGIKHARWHFMSCCDLIETPNVAFFSKLVKFQTRFHWHPVVPLFSRPNTQVSLMLLKLGLLSVEQEYEVLNTCHSGAAWLMRLRQEIEQDKDLFSARQVYLQGVKSTPWYLPLVSEGMEKLSSVLSTLEKEQLTQLMYEKDFRIV